MNNDKRKPIDVLLKEEGKMLKRGCEMLELGENGKSYCLNRPRVPEITTEFTPRERELHYVAKTNRYDY